MAGLRKHWLAILLFMAWLPPSLTLWPLPSESMAVGASSTFRDLGKDYDKIAHLYSEAERKQMDRDLEVLTDSGRLLSRMWARWIAVLAVVVFGLLTVAYTALRGRFWKPMVMASSSCYLVIVTAFPASRAFRAEQWQGWWMMVSEYPSWGSSAFVYGVVLPFLHAALALGTLASLGVLALKSSNLTLRSRRTP